MKGQKVKRGSLGKATELKGNENESYIMRHNEHSIINTPLFVYTASNFKAMRGLDTDS